MNHTVIVSRNDSHLLFKAVFGFALFVVVLVGAGLSLAGKEFPLWQGIAAGLAGGMFGFVAARKFKITHSAE